MKFTVLVDNKAGDRLVTDYKHNGAVECEATPNSCNLKPEWGLSILIEYEDKLILLDAGASGLFAENARRLGLDLSRVDYAVLSHAHYDHADGMETFFELNKKADFYISPMAEENCYSIMKNDKSPTGFDIKYDGIKPGTLSKYADRIVRAEHKEASSTIWENSDGIVRAETCEDESQSRLYTIADGVSLLGHSTEGLDRIGEKVGQYLVVDCDYIPDDFAHEQSLIFNTDKGLVVFNSCSHGGVDNIIREAMAAFPGERVYAMIGGFHLFMENEQEVREHARRIKAAGAKRIITGHCTGEEQYRWLKDELENGESCGCALKDELENGESIADVAENRDEVSKSGMNEESIIVEQLHCGLVVEL